MSPFLCKVHFFNDRGMLTLLKIKVNKKEIYSRKFLNIQQVHLARLCSGIGTVKLITALAPWIRLSHCSDIGIFKSILTPQTTVQLSTYLCNIEITLENGNPMGQFRDWDKDLVTLSRYDCMYCNIQYIQQCVCSALHRLSLLRDAAVACWSLRGGSLATHHAEAMVPGSTPANLPLRVSLIRNLRTIGVCMQ